MTPYKTQGDALKQTRSLLKLTRRQLAELCGVSINTVRNWEQGWNRVSGPARKIIDNLK